MIPSIVLPLLLPARDIIIMSTDIVIGAGGKETIDVVEFLTND